MLIIRSFKDIPSVLPFMNDNPPDDCELLDARGLTCPMPLLKAKQALNRLSAGALLRVLATDPGSVRDFEVFAAQSGHELLAAETDGGEYRYLLRKKAG